MPYIPLPPNFGSSEEEIKDSNGEIILFIDEIHRMPRYIEEILYPAMEDFYLDIVIGGEGGSRNIKIDLPPFTLVGATTRVGMLTAPLRDRFGVVQHLEFYSLEELMLIIQHSARILGVEIDEKGAVELARRSRGTPRLANRLLKRVRDFAQIKGTGIITQSLADMALDMLEIDIKNIIDYLGEVTGESYDNELIDKIFSRFCLGK